MFLLCDTTGLFWFLLFCAISDVYRLLDSDNVGNSVCVLLAIMLSSVTVTEDLESHNDSVHNVCVVKNHIEHKNLATYSCELDKYFFT